MRQSPRSAEWTTAAAIVVVAIVISPIGIRLATGRLDLPTVGGKDWYRWGAEILVANQQPLGNWDKGGYHGASRPLDTSLALLFLKRANLAKDLTARLPFDKKELEKTITHKAGSLLPTSPGGAPDAPAQNKR